MEIQQKYGTEFILLWSITTTKCLFPFFLSLFTWMNRKKKMRKPCGERLMADFLFTKRMRICVTARFLKFYSFISLNDGETWDCLEHSHLRIFFPIHPSRRISAIVVEQLDSHWESSNDFSFLTQTWPIWIAYYIPLWVSQTPRTFARINFVYFLECRRRIRYTGLPKKGGDRMKTKTCEIKIHTCTFLYNSRN